MTQRLLYALLFVLTVTVRSFGQEASSSGPVTGDLGQLPALIEQLGSADYEARETAQKAIEAFGFEAFDLLTEAEAGDDPEIAARARYLVRRMQVEWAAATDSAEVKRILANYAQGDDRQRKQTIEALAALANGEGLPALARLVRFENAQLRSKQAGIRAVESLSKQAALGDDVVTVVERTLGQSNRPGADWMRTALHRQSDPAAAIDAWGKHVEAEQETFRTFPQRSHVDFIRAMIRVQAEWLQGLERREEADVAMRRLVALDPGTNQSLQELIHWFTERQAWHMLDELQRRFDDRIERDAILLYRLASARERQGAPEQAEALVTKALALYDEDPARHYQVARVLTALAMRRYAIRELEKVVAAGPPEAMHVLESRVLLAEAYYDRGDNLAAAASLKAALDAVEKAPPQARIAETLRMRDPASMKARMLFCEAVEAAKTDPAAAAVKFLAALDADESDLDVLIALHRHEGLSDDQRQRVRGLIVKAAELQRMVIRDSSRDATPYNQLAWLLANTDGDRQEALACSLKSLELSPNDPGYLDTLGHCYFALGDFDNAIKTQEKAAAADPESGLLARALERFRAAKAEQDKGKE